MSQEEIARNVSIGLYRIARDPERTHDLHQLLRDFGHQMRNRLNSLKLGLYLGRRIDEEAGGQGDDWAQVEREYQALERLFEQYQAVWQPMRIRPVRLCLGLFLREKVQRWRPGFRGQGVGVALVVPDDPPIARFDASQFGTALDRFARWRTTSAEEGDSVRIVLGADGEQAHLTWDESASRIGFGANECSAWVALPMLARVVTSHGGTIDLDTSAGFRLRLHWPLEGPSREPSCVEMATSRNAVLSSSIPTST